MTLIWFKGNPEWYYNILANLQVTVEIGSEQFQAHAAITEEPERTHLYNQMVGGIRMSDRKFGTRKRLVTE